MKMSEYDLNSINNTSISNESTLISTEKEKIKNNQGIGKNYFDKKINILSNLMKISKENNFQYIFKKIPGTSLIQYSKKSNNISKEQKVKDSCSIQGGHLLKEKKNEPRKLKFYSKKILGRKRKQSGELWNNNLKLNFNKNKWSKEEDCLLFSFYKKYNGSWKKLSFLLDKRTEKSIKKHFFLQLRKKEFQNNKEQQNSKSKIKLNDLLKYLDIVSIDVKKKFCEKRKMNDSQFNDFIKIKEEKLNLLLSKKVWFENINKNKKSDFLLKEMKRNNINNEEIEKKDNIIKKEEKNSSIKIKIKKFLNKTLDIVNTISFQLLVKDITDLSPHPLTKSNINNLFNFNTIINVNRLIVINNFYNNFEKNNSKFEPSNIINNNYCDNKNTIIIPQNNYSKFDREEEYYYHNLYRINEILREIQTQYFIVIGINSVLNNLLTVLNLLEKQ